MRHYLPLSLVLLVASCASVRLSSDESAAMKAVEHVVHLDRSGARLDPNRRHVIDAALTEPDTNAWDEFFVISSWKYAKPELANGQLQFQVRYTIEGHMQGNVFTPVDAADADLAAEIDRNANIILTAINGSGKWKVQLPDTPPHVSFAVARKWAESMSADAALQEISDAEYVAKLKSSRAGNCNCGRLDF